MKINLSEIRNDPTFMCHDHVLNGETVTLVQPQHIGAVWTKDNLHFRSSVWTQDGEPVSLSYMKFFNWGEKPELAPIPNSLEGAHLLEKIDGSTLCFSMRNGHLIARTRGTVDVRIHENGHEIDTLIQKYPKFFKAFIGPTSAATFIFEWVSPAQKIVVSYPEVDMFLTGIIYHDDYSMAKQVALDNFAKDFDLRRPKVYNYNSIEEMKKSVEDFKGVEGICVYYDNDSKILKLKGSEYLFLHRAKSDISSIDKVSDLYLNLFFDSRSTTLPTFSEFFSYLEKHFDYEIAEMASVHSLKIVDSMKEVQNLVYKAAFYAYDLKGLSRKDAALKILSEWKENSSLVFGFLSDKPITKESYKKLLDQILSKTS